MRLSDESTAKFEIKLVDKQIQKIKQAKKDCQTHYGKQLGCGTCKALQLCAWIDKLVDTIEALQKYIKTLQKENTGWQKRYYELDTGHSKLFKDFCKLLEKQIPQKVKKYKGLNETTCPNCRFVFGYYEYDDEKFDYCYNCGQRLSWESEVEHDE